MNKSYWLVNPNRSEVKRFIKNLNNQDQFYEYFFIDSGKVVGIFGDSIPIMQYREEFKLEEAREIWKNLLSHGWRRTSEVWQNQD